MSKFVKADITKDFWEINPEISLITVFREFREEERNSSMIMWAIYLTEDPNSKLYKLRDIKERRSEVEKNFLKVKDFKWENYNTIIQAYVDITMSENEKSFKTWTDKAREMDVYVGTLQFGPDDNTLFKMFKEARAIWSTLHEIQKKLVEEEEESVIKGKGELSDRDKRYG